MKTKMTPQQALVMLREGQLGHLMGLDEHDYTYIFDDANEVFLLTYYHTQPSLAAVIEEHKEEILSYAERAKGVMLRLRPPKNGKLSIEDMENVPTVQNLFKDNTEFTWWVDVSDSSDSGIIIDLFITI